MRHPAAQKPAELIAANDRSQTAIASHDVPVALPETQVHVTTGTGLCGIGLRHERHAHSQAVGHFLEALFENSMPVCHGQDSAVSHVQFMLSLAPLALGTLHRNTG